MEWQETRTQSMYLSRAKQINRKRGLPGVGSPGLREVPVKEAARKGLAEKVTDE